MRVYGQSKLANILFTLELARRLEGSGVTANSLHPGTVRTGYGADGDARGLLAFGIKIASPFFLSPAKGARTSVYLASSPEVEGVSGEYFVKCKPKRPKPWAQDPEAARRLWQVSEELVGLAPPPESLTVRVLVTGAARAIGRATVEVLADRGHEVVATARDASLLEGLPAAQILALDVSDDASVRRRRGRRPASSTPWSTTPA